MWNAFHNYRQKINSEFSAVFTLCWKTQQKDSETQHLVVLTAMIYYRDRVGIHSWITKDRVTGWVWRHSCDAFLCALSSTRGRIAHSSPSNENATIFVWGFCLGNPLGTLPLQFILEICQIDTLCLAKCQTPEGKQMFSINVVQTV